MILDRPKITACGRAGWDSRHPQAPSTTSEVNAASGTSTSPSFPPSIPISPIAPTCAEVPAQWDWGPSKFGRCPLDHADRQGRAVDVMLWVIPNTSEPLDGLVF